MGKQQLILNCGVAEDTDQPAGPKRTLPVFQQILIKSGTLSPEFRWDANASGFSSGFHRTAPNMTHPKRIFGGVLAGVKKLFFGLKQAGLRLWVHIWRRKRSDENGSFASRNSDRLD